MKNITILVVVTIAMFFSCGINFAQNTSIVVGMDQDYPPFGYYDGKSVTGYNVDYLDELKKATGIEFVLKPGKWNKLLKEMESGKIDAMIGIIHSQSRAEKMDFTIPYTYDNATIFVSSKSNFKKIGDLENAVMSHQKNDAIALDFLNNYGFNFKSSEYESLTQAFLSISEGKSDFTVAPYSVAKEIIKNNKIDNLVTFGDSIQTYHYRISVAKGSLKTTPWMWI